MKIDRVLTALKVLSAVAALWFLIVVPCWYAWQYLNEPLNSYRGEYLQGVAISVMFLAPAPVIAFFITRFFLRKRGL